MAFIVMTLGCVQEPQLAPANGDINSCYPRQCSQKRAIIMAGSLEVQLAMLSNGWEPGSKAEAWVVSHKERKETLVASLNGSQGFVEHFGDRRRGGLRDEAGDRTRMTRREISSNFAPRIQRRAAEP